MRTDNKFIKLILALALLGILVSGWLLSIHIRFSTGQAGLTENCSVLPGVSGQGCASIAVSDYSDVFGVPLAAIAMSYYFTIVILVFWSLRNMRQALEPLYVSFFLSTISILVTVTMFYISRFIVKSYCMGCSVLWLINLSIWPCFVKQLGLRWSNALGANLEIIRSKLVHLQKDLVLKSFLVGGISLLALSIIGAASKNLSKEASFDPANSTILAEYNAAPMVMLPEEVYGGPSSKGYSATKENPALMDIVEFADFQCPACRMAAQYFKPFLLKHKDEVRLTFHNFPLDGSCNPYAANGRHMLACKAAKASICAGKENLFWPLHDHIYDKQDELSDALLDEMPKNIGVNTDQFKSCLEDKNTMDTLLKEMSWADLIKLESTPTIIINGRLLVGAKSPGELELLLQHLRK